VATLFLNPIAIAMRLIDSHSHFDDSSFDADRDATWARARAVGVVAQIVPAVSAALWPQVQQVCGAYPDLYPAYGLHPIYLAQHNKSDLIELEHWLEREPAVAVGECGLDFYLTDLARAPQIEFFMIQVEIARAHDLPLIIHARRAVEDVILLLRQMPGARGVVHSFAGSAEQARRLIDMGFYLSFGGPITYPRARRLRELATQLPLNAILLETDAPDQPLCERQGQRNEPAYLYDVLQTLAALRGTDPAEIAALTTRNTIELFRLPL
jgi:TatD DNase family protein